MRPLPERAGRATDRRADAQQAVERGLGGRDRAVHDDGGAHEARDIRHGLGERRPEVLLRRQRRHDAGARDDEALVERDSRDRVQLLALAAAGEQARLADGERHVQERVQPLRRV